MQEVRISQAVKQRLEEYCRCNGQILETVVQDAVQMFLQNARTAPSREAATGE